MIHFFKSVSFGMILVFSATFLVAQTKSKKNNSTTSSEQNAPTIDINLGDELQLKFISWKAIDGADLYLLEIKDSKQKVFVSTKLKDNFYGVESLPVGFHHARVTPLDFFGKPTVWSQWTGLQIRISKKPAIETPPQPYVPKSPNDDVMEIKGENLIEETEVKFIKDKSPGVKAKNLEVDPNGTSMKVQVDLKKIEDGNYDLSIKNPFKQPVVTANYLKIDKKNFEVAPPPPVAVAEVKKEIPPPVASAEVKKEIPPPVAVAEVKKEIPLPVASEKVKKEAPPPPVEVPKGTEYYKFSYPEYKAYATSLPKTCPNTPLPDKLVLHCEGDYVVLDLKSKDNRDLFYFLLAENGNFRSQRKSREYFEKNCFPNFRPAVEKYEKDSLNPSIRTLIAQKTELEASVARIKACPNAKKE